MIDLYLLLKENPKKNAELSAFYWFAEAIDLEYESICITERPDFIIQCQSQKIGIEITRAERRLPANAFTAQQIESCQRDFAEKLLDYIEPELPLAVGLIFNDDVAVETKDNKALEVLAPLINKISENMVPHSVELLVRRKTDIPNSTQKKHTCSEVPEFLQYIQLFNDGHEFSVVESVRGGFLDYFTEVGLRSILEKKHRALAGYTKCDQHWLVIVSGQVPPLFVEHETPSKLLIPSMATSFAGADINIPIESDFDKVYFFKSPSDAIPLT